MFGTIKKPLRTMDVHTLEDLKTKEERCFYSGLQMSLPRGDPDWICSLEVSIHRMDTLDGVALCVAELNGRAQWTAEKISTLHNMILAESGWRDHMQARVNEARNRENEDANRKRKRKGILTADECVSVRQLLAKIEDLTIKELNSKHSVEKPACKYPEVEKKIEHSGTVRISFIFASSEIGAFSSCACSSFKPMKSVRIAVKYLEQAYSTHS